MDVKNAIKLFKIWYLQKLIETNCIKLFYKLTTHPHSPQI